MKDSYNYFKAGKIYKKEFIIRILFKPKIKQNKSIKLKLIKNAFKLTF